MFTTSAATFGNKLLSNIFRIAHLTLEKIVWFWRRTPGKWNAIIFNDTAEFAVLQSFEGRALPSGRVTGNQPVEYDCYSALGLSKSCFSTHAPFRVVHIDGRAGDEFTFYFSGDLVAGYEVVNGFEGNVTFLPRSELKSFVPSEIVDKL